MEQLDADMTAELAAHGPLVATPARARLDNIALFKADGRTIDLGRPGTLRFRWRVRRYIRKETRHG